jgi:hypothetical protein
MGQTQNFQYPLTLSKLDEAYKKKIINTNGINYRGYIGGPQLKGTIVMQSEFSQMNKSNNWGHPETIEIDFSEAQPYKISGSTVFTLGDFKAGGTIKSDYSTIKFKYSNQQIFGNIVPTASSMYWVKCYNESQNDNLWFFQGTDNKWYYICTN